MINDGLKSAAPEHDDDYRLEDEENDVTGPDEYAAFSRDVKTCLTRLRRGIVKIRYVYLLENAVAFC